MKSRKSSRGKFQIRCLSVWTKVEYIQQNLGKHSSCKFWIMLCYKHKCVFIWSLTEANGEAQGINLWDASDNCELQNSSNESALIYKV